MKIQLDSCIPNSLKLLPVKSQKPGTFIWLRNADWPTEPHLTVIAGQSYFPVRQKANPPEFNTGQVRNRSPTDIGFNTDAIFSAIAYQASVNSEFRRPE